MGRHYGSLHRLYRFRDPSCGHLRFCGEEHYKSADESYIQWRLPLPDIHDNLHDIAIHISRACHLLAERAYEIGCHKTSVGRKLPGGRDKYSFRKVWSVKIYIKTNVGVPEIPPEVEVAPGTLRDLLLNVLGGLKLGREIIDPATGAMNLEGLFEVRLNSISSHSLEQGLDVELHDGDVVGVNLMVFGGG